MIGGGMAQQGSQIETEPVYSLAHLTLINATPA